MHKPLDDSQQNPVFFKLSNICPIVQILEQHVQKHCLKSHYSHIAKEEKLMAVTSKKLTIYSATGISLAIVIIAAIFASGIIPQNSTTTNVPMGKLFVSIKDAPVDLKNLNVTIDELYVHNDDNSTWIKLNFTEGKQAVYFDLLALQNVTKELSVSDVPAGNYSKIRLHVISANATFFDNSTATLNVPSERLDIIIKFEVQKDQATELLIDMQADWVAISKSNNLRPILKATVV
jgi:hypothetical protein